MKKSYTKIHVSGSFGIACAVLCLAPVGIDRARAETRAEPARAMTASPGIKDLLADAPAPGLAKDLQLFGQFVGNWKTRHETYLPGRTDRGTGHVHIGWILYGTALQDVWTGDAPAARPGYPQKSFGTTIRFFDDRSKVWRIIWVAPVERVVQTFVAREIDGEIVLEGPTPDGGARERWIWSNYTRDSFEWRSAESSDDGKTWKITQRIWGTRTSAASATARDSGSAVK